MNLLSPYSSHFPYPMGRGGERVAIQKGLTIPMLTCESGFQEYNFGMDVMSKNPRESISSETVLYPSGALFGLQVEEGGRRVRGREYSWGAVNIEDKVTITVFSFSPSVALQRKLH
jgi:hypothetical protein